MAAFWSVGTITLAANSPSVTGHNTDFMASELRAGDTIESDDGRRATILSVNAAAGANAITLDKPWRGAGQSDAAYKAWYTPDDVELEGLARRALSAMSSGNLTAFAELALEAGKGFHATGAGTLATHDLTPFARTLLDDANEAAFWDTLGPTSPANVAFRRGNILGNVSQSGGTPTGAIIERGSNSNGEYVRYADGTQICWNSTIIHNDVSVAPIGQVYHGTVDNGWTFPAAFSSNPINQASDRGSSAVILGLHPYAVNGSGSSLRVTAPGSGTIANLRPSYFAIGRWF